MRLNETVHDLLGREILVGDMVAYPVTVGRSAAMRIGRVVGFDHPKEYDGKLRLSEWRMQLLYTDESMDWGVYGDVERDIAWHIHCICDPDAKPWKEISEPDWIKMHEEELAKAERKLAKGPHPKTVLFPGKAIIVNNEYMRRRAE